MIASRDSKTRRGAQTAPGRSHRCSIVAASSRRPTTTSRRRNALLAAAADRSRELGLPFEHGRSLLALGTVRRRLQQKLAARETLEEARLLLDRLGARIWTARAEAELRRIGGRRNPAGSALSETESQIAALVSNGHTNSEVAVALQISRKTVEWNLSKIYRKLDVRSRTELAARTTE